ncbi:DUF2786 domain-containing protein [Actinokineospora sp.]|uniref:DUF2786 domain-containing protein n=1 Tax=Actinokineospora sp. TaxID=1872133 RepID=UPI003D6BFEC9
MRTHDRETRGSVAVLAARLTEAAAVRSRGAPRAASAYVRDVAANGPEQAGAAAASALEHTVELLWRRGWLPADVVAATPRGLSSLLVDTVAAQTARYRQLHPRWRQQLTEIGAEIWWTGVHLPQWSRSKRLPLVDALTKVVDLIAALMVLPQLPHLVPEPGEPFVRETTPSGVDARVLIKVRGLLAKAESTAFPEEAEALSAKAQELMARYAFEQAVVEGIDDRPQDAAAHRLWLDAPYQGPKAQLVDVVAGANRCRAVFYPKLGCVVLVGHETDVEIVTMLTRSLQVQAEHALAGSPSRGRAYRHSFLVAYAHRIRERLAAAGAQAASGDTRLVPVLARRDAAVTARFEAMFPGVRVRRSSVSSAAGWGAGLLAADRADLQPGRRRIAG